MEAEQKSRQDDDQMPKGPKGEKRPADVIGNAVHVMRIATGQVEDSPSPGRRAGGLKGGKARAEKLSDARKRQIAKKAAEARWRRKEPSSS
jgi:hypothetical protein